MKNADPSPLYLLILAACGSLVSALHGCEPFKLILPVACGWNTEGEDEDRAAPYPRIPDRVVFLHTEEKPCHTLFECCRTIHDLREYQIRELGWPDIGFNFLIGDDGRAYVGRGWDKTGQFSLRYNERALSVAFVGNYYYKRPTGKALDVAMRLLRCSVSRVRLASNYTIHMHEDIECTRNLALALKGVLLSAPHFRYKGKVSDYVRC